MAGDGMVWVPDQTFLMGSDEHYVEEEPAHYVAVDGFSMSTTQVTNAEYAHFVEASGYVTVAERPLQITDALGTVTKSLQPGSMVFRRTAGPVDLRCSNLWWAWTAGASWRHPEGPESDLDGREEHPVVHVAYEDALAYATWAGLGLPSEAEWEAAARAGKEGLEFVWGDHPEDSPTRLANYWHGDFPWRPDPGYGHTRAVGSFPANGYGLFDMAGNVWEWTNDFYADRHGDEGTDVLSAPRNPLGPDVEKSYDTRQSRPRVPRRVIKGGSFLCADSYCRRYRPAARRPQRVDTGMSHIGFRCISRSGR